MLHFMQLAHPRHMDINIQNSKHKGQNIEVTSFEHRTQNICIQNTVSYIGFRSTRVAMFECCIALFFYVHGKNLRSCRDGQLT